jgi:UDP-N-acetylmuramate dehydrogenase
MRIEENRLLAPLTTFGIGGPARWFAEAASEDEIVEATAWARERGLALFVLGGGSNLLVSDAGFDGLVLRVGLKGIQVSSGLAIGDRAGEEFPSGAKAQDDSRQPMYGLKPVPSTTKPVPFTTKPATLTTEPVALVSGDDGQKTYRAAAGEDWDSFVQRTVEDNCAGIECLAGIPGTVGGTPVQNVGAYGQEVGSRITRVRAFDLHLGLFTEFTAEECGFAYRRSRFNSTDRGRYIVTRVDFMLSPGGAPAIRYADLKQALETSAPEGRQPSLAEVAAAVRRVRAAKGMLLVEGDADCRSAGSFFKNPVVSEEMAERIAAASAKELPRFSTGPEGGGSVKLPAAWLIEQAGFAKGYARGRAGVSSRHTLALVNRGGASAAEVVALAEEIRDAVEARFEIRLEMEPVMLGFGI